MLMHIPRGRPGKWGEPVWDGDRREHEIRRALHVQERRGMTLRGSGPQAVRLTHPELTLYRTVPFRPFPPIHPPRRALLQSMIAWATAASAPRACVGNANGTSAVISPASDFGRTKRKYASAYLRPSSCCAAVLK